MTARRAALVLLVVEGALALAFAIHTALSFQRDLSPIDEAAHLSYVQLVAEEQRLPVLGRDAMTREAYALSNDLDLDEADVPDLSAGLGAHSYEAFQPPVYYAVAGVVHAVAPGGHESKFLAVRMLGVLLVVATFAAVVITARSVSAQWWLEIAVVACSIFVMPGLLVRMVTVSNAALEPLVATAVVWASLEAARRRSVRLAAALPPLVAVALLTKLTLVAVAPAAAIAFVAVLLGVGRDRRAVATLAIGVGIALAVLAPWFVWNRATYGAWTANETAKEMQAYIVNPDGQDYVATDVAVLLPESLLVAHAQETGPDLIRPYSGLGWFVAAALIVLPALLVTRGVAPGLALGVLGVPLAASIVLFAVVTVVEDWPTMLPRYLWPALPAWGVLAGAAYVGRGDGKVAVRVAGALVAAGTVLAWWSFGAPAWTA